MDLPRAEFVETGAFLVHKWGQSDEFLPTNLPTKILKFRYGSDVLEVNMHK